MASSLGEKMAVLSKLSRSVLLLVGVGSASLVGCFNNGATVTSKPGADGGVGASSLPCDVQAVLANSCQSCHSDPPVGGAPMALMTWDDLQAGSSVAGKNEGQLSLDRMMATSKPMPPQGGASADDITTMQNWINAGQPKGSCGTEQPPAPDPYATDPICTSGKTNSLNNAGPAMGPGENCMDSQCHGDTTWSKAFAFAGTVYPTAHEPDDCVGVTTGALSVTVTDKNGKKGTAKVIPGSGKSIGSAGNFYLFLYDRTGTKMLEPGPMTDIVVNGPNGTRAMSQTAPSGACNECHTQTGTLPDTYKPGFKTTAPGRIMAP
jgi:hypothetical protein